MMPSISAIEMAIGAVVGALVAAAIMLLIYVPIAKHNARDAGYAQAQTDALKRSQELQNQRSKTNAEVGQESDAGVCAALGGRWVPDTKSCE